MAKKSEIQKKRRSRPMTPAQRREVIRRIEGGESMAAIARDIGFTRESVRSLIMRHRENGDAAFETGKPKGRQALPKLRKVHLDYLRKTLPGKSPRRMGIENGSLDVEKWNALELQELISRKFSIRPSREECVKVLRKMGYQKNSRFPSRFANWRERLSTEFAEWTRTPEAKELKRRERIYLGKEKRAGDDFQKRGAIFLTEREWRAKLRRYQVDDPVLAKSEPASIAERLTEIETGKPGRAKKAKNRVGGGF